MDNSLTAPTNNTQVAKNDTTDARVSLQNFTERLNLLPTSDSVDKTPDGKANTVLISHIEMTLDEYFFGLWSTENFKWSVIANEIVGSIDLIVIHPVNGMEIRRSGAGAIQIMVDAAPEEVKKVPSQKNRWALNPDNKKSNALDMGFPKLKAECLKNAAQSLGKLFGRDLNRKKSDVFTPLLNKKEILNDKLTQLDKSKTPENV